PGDHRWQPGLIDSHRSERAPPIPSNRRLVPGRSPSLFDRSSDLHGSRSTGQRMHTMTRTSSIDGVELSLASPDTHDAAWVDYNEYILQLEAAWVRLSDVELPLNPRLIGESGLGKTTLACFVGRRLGREVYI